MLRIKPEERESAVRCVDRGEFLWYLLAQAGNSTSEAHALENPTESFPNVLHVDDADVSVQIGGPEIQKEACEEKEMGSREKVASSREKDNLAEGDSEADTELLGERTLNPHEWSSLEREFAGDQAAVIGSVPVQFANVRTGRKRKHQSSDDVIQNVG